MRIRALNDATHCLSGGSVNCRRTMFPKSEAICCTISAQRPRSLPLATGRIKLTLVPRERRLLAQLRLGTSCTSAAHVLDCHCLGLGLLSSEAYCSNCRRYHKLINTSRNEPRDFL